MFRFLKYSLICIVVLILDYNIGLCAETAIEKVNCGMLNVGQTKYVSIPIINDGDIPLVVETVSVCCGNPQPSIDMMTIPQGETAKLTQKVKKTKPGTFTITIHVRFKEPKNKALTFSIKGETKQPISTSIGWSEEALNSVDYFSSGVKLNQVSCSGKDLTLCLFSEPNQFNLENSISSIKSRYFSLDASSLKYSKNKSCSSVLAASIKDVPEQITCQKVDTKGKPCNNQIGTLYFVLKSKPPFPVGELNDNIVVVFKDGSECYVPISFRSIGDVYGECSSIGIGRISGDGKINKTFKIYFSNGVKLWKQVKWNVEGKFSDAVKVVVSKTEDSESYLNLTIEIDGSYLPLSEKGFISSYISFFENSPDDDNLVKLLMYGYK